MNIRHAHFIGIAGAGMSATAKLLRDCGVTVTGSDEGVYPPVSDFLMQQQIHTARDTLLPTFPPMPTLSSSGRMQD